MSDRFDFAQSIQDCWRITDDIRMIGDSIQDRGLSVVNTSIALAGLAALYELKFNNLWELFEEVHMNLVRENKMLNEECGSLRQQFAEKQEGNKYS